MKKHGQLTGAMIGIFITLMIGVILLSVIVSIVGDQTSQSPIGNDTFVGQANTTCTQVTDNCIFAGSVGVTNTTTVLTSGTNFTECNSNGAARLNGVILTQAQYTGSNLNATYSEISCGYIESGLTRLVIDNYAVFLAIALIMFLAAFIVLK